MGAEKCFPLALRHGRGRYVLCLGCDPDYAFAISPEDQFGGTFCASTKTTFSSLAYPVGNSGAVRYCAEHVLGERTGIYDSNILAAVGGDVRNLQRLSIGTPELRRVSTLRPMLVSIRVNPMFWNERGAEGC